MTTDDMELVRQYAAEQSESAFAMLVSRHASLVYSVALRQAGDPHLAEEITQAVFIILARKAGSLNEKTILSGWLYRAACYTSNAARKQEHRRQRREQEAYMESTLQGSEANAAWKQMSPLLEEAMLRLGQADRDALMLRFFEGRSLNEVGAALGASEEAAKKRVNRALEKLHRFFTKRGISSTTAIIAGEISANSVQAAPVALATSVTAAALAKGAMASTSTLTLIKGALKLMAWQKTKMAIVAGVAVLLTTGTVIVLASLDARAGVVLVVDVEYGGPNREIPSMKNVTVKIKGEKYREDDQGFSEIHDIKTKKIIYLDHAQKKFTKLSGDTVFTVGEKAMKTLEIADTGRQEKVGDNNSEIYTAKVKGGKYTFWVTRDIPNSAAIREQMKMLPGLPDFPDSSKIDGLVVKKEIAADDGEKILTVTLRSAKEAPVDDAEFQIPAGYTKAANTGNGDDAGVAGPPASTPVPTPDHL
ncbi:MAG TPA: sigma-70 family RNA polymerase sigma factor [Chthoniobacteraceae bacterium]|nr:sigma-70 family RNA polymerase sigma factor [Chthoniobacteraceae bacterium]